MVGVDFKVKMLNMEGTKVKLTVWDTAGQERFRTLTSSYYRGAHGVVLVYDVCSRESFKSLRDVWMKELETYAQPAEMILMVIANKIDKVISTKNVTKSNFLRRTYGKCQRKRVLNTPKNFQRFIWNVVPRQKLVLLLPLKS